MIALQSNDRHWCHKLWIILILNFFFDPYTSIIPLQGPFCWTTEQKLSAVIGQFGGNYCAEAQSFQDGGRPSCITSSFPHLDLCWRCTKQFLNVVIKIREGLNSHFHAHIQSVSWFEVWPLTPPLQKILFVLSNFPVLTPDTDRIWIRLSPGISGPGPSPEDHLQPDAATTIILPSDLEGHACVLAPSCGEFVCLRTHEHLFTAQCLQKQWHKSLVQYTQFSKIYFMDIC